MSGAVEADPVQPCKQKKRAFARPKTPSPQPSYVATGGLLLILIFQWTNTYSFFLVCFGVPPEIAFSLFRQTTEQL